MLDEMQHELGRSCMRERMMLCRANVLSADVTDGETLRH